MSEIKHAPVWYPPQFPLQGRLPSRDSQLYQNHHRQSSMERAYHNALAVASGRRGTAPCCKTLHISLFFDGTGNNLNNDLYLSNPSHPTNIARLFRASIGAGYAGGTAHGTSTASGLTDADGVGLGDLFKYYMPGVGTPFPEVGDLDYGPFGLALAGYGEERINWGLLMILDALRRALNLPRQSNDALLAAVKAMGSFPGLESVTGLSNRKRAFYTQFAPLIAPLRIAMSKNPGQCELLGIKLYVYGFSRGAAAARAFVSWLNQLLSPSEETLSLKMLDVALPISVEYLGLLDTVASVGLANLMTVTEGHMGWADGTQELPRGQLVKRCLHIVSSHEQRLCFPLDSIRRETGEYPDNSVEVIHPGVHSDQGGGYPPGDQGKAIGEDDGLLLSQIALHDLYSDAFAHGAPLKVPKVVLPIELRHQLWRAMEAEVEIEFALAHNLINRFNAWRHTTLGLIPATQPLPIERVEQYQPVQAPETLEQALRDQMAWLTAWRIDRYGFASLKQTEFYKAATDSEADEQVREGAKAKRNEQQAAIEKRRREQLARERNPSVPKLPQEPGVKDFDPDMAQTQLKEAAEEFAADYRVGLTTAVALWAAQTLLGPMAGRAQVQTERLRMKADGQARVGQLFPPPRYGESYLDENTRGRVDESRNAEEPEGLLRALFDDQVHDSRAWFLYAALQGTVGGREPAGSYLRDRMVFFGDNHSRALALYDQKAQPVLASAVGLPTIEPAHPPMMNAEQLAVAQKNIAAVWDEYYARQRGEVNDASV